MKFLSSKKGYTLVELLAVIAIITIVAAFSLTVFGELKRISDNRVDQSRIVVYNKAFEDFRFTDYSTLQSTPDEHVIIVEGGKIKINQYLNLSGQDIEALSNSGRGKYPQNKRECVAVIRAYCGTNEILPIPAAGVSYSYYYHIPEGKCYVKAITDVSETDTDWINLNEYYTLITQYLVGDANGDTNIDEEDIKTIKDIISGTIDKKTYDPFLLESADTDRNGVVNRDDWERVEDYINTGNSNLLLWD